MMTKTCLKFYYLVALVVCMQVPAFAQDEPVSSRINYISNQNVYVDKGSKAGLAVGDTLYVEVDGQKTAGLLIVYTAQYSASCERLDNKIKLETGQQVILVKQKAAPAVDKAVTGLAVNQPQTEKIKPDKTRAPFARISGGLAFQWYHYQDLGENKMHFDQPTMRFDLKARQLWGKEYTFRIRIRVRRNERTRSYSSQTPQEEWRNRIYHFYFRYDNPLSTFNYMLGRIISNKISGVGYLDGILLQHNITSMLQWGLYGGIQSYWQFAGADPSLQKYGLFINYLSGKSETKRFDATLAFNTVYHGDTVSRENVYFRSSFRYNNSLFVYNSFEVDINRSWKKEKTGDVLSLTSLYLSARYRFSEIITAGLTYDNRKNYYTYETRDIPEEIFDQAFRHGLKADISLTLPSYYQLYARFGINGRQHDSKSTYAGRIGVRKNHLFARGLSLAANIRGYDNNYSRGWIPSLSISQQFIYGYYLSLSAGQNVYEEKLFNDKRYQQWLRLNAHLSLYAGLYLSGYYTYEWGDDLTGHKVIAEMGYRF